MLKDIIKIYKRIFKELPIFKLFMLLVIVKGVVFSAYVYDVKYMRELNDILGLVIIIVGAIIMLNCNKRSSK